MLGQNHWRSSREFICHQHERKKRRGNKKTRCWILACDLTCCIPPLTVLLLPRRCSSSVCSLSILFWFIGCFFGTFPLFCYSFCALDGLQLLSSGSYSHFLLLLFFLSLSFYSYLLLIVKCLSLPILHISIWNILYALYIHLYCILSTDDHLAAGWQVLPVLWRSLYAYLSLVHIIRVKRLLLNIKIRG